MPGEKRKAAKSALERDKRSAPGFICRCEDGDHVNEAECERERNLTIHKDIADKAFPWSEKVQISVGSNQQTFHVDKFLLKLHSGYFRNKFADLEEEQDQKFSLPSVNPGLFTEFVCWMKSGRFMPVPSEVMHSDPLNVGERSWALGQFLRAPGFQNFAMDDCRTYCQNPTNPWPLAETVRLVYQLTGRDSKLRKFAAHSVARKNPFDEYGEKDQEYGPWCNLFKDCPDLGLDMARAAGTKWGDTYPWDDEHRAMYMEEEQALDQLWEEQILEARSLEEIKRAAKNKDIQSKIELDHLQRNKEK